MRAPAAALGLVLLVGCPAAEPPTRFESHVGALVLTDDKETAIQVGVRHPSEIRAGGMATLGIIVSNPTTYPAELVRVRFEDKTAGDPFFQGFAIERSRPPGSNVTQGRAFLAADYGPLAAGGKMTIDIDLKAVRPGGYGTTVMVVAMERGRVLALYEHAIHAVIRAP